MAEVDETYRDKRPVEAMSKVNIILSIDPTNEFALKYLRDLKPMIEEETQKLYTQAMNFVNDNKLSEAKNKFNVLLTIDPNHITAKKRLEEVNERLSKTKDIA